MSIGAMLGGSLIQGVGSLVAGNMQANAARDAAQQGNATLSNYYGKVENNNQPYMQAGQNAVGTLSKDVQQGTGFASPFTMSNFYNDPGYQFTLQQGQNAIENSAAARGGLLSGAAAKGMASYASGLANQTYGDAFNRYLQNRQQGFGELAGVAQLGQNSINNTNSAALQTGSHMADNTINGITGAANAQASGIMGATNAAAGGMSNLGQYYQMRNMGIKN